MSPDHVSLDDLSNFVDRSHGRSLAGSEGCRTAGAFAESEVVAQLVHYCHPEAEERPLPMVARQRSVWNSLQNVRVHHREVEQAEENVLPPLASGSTDVVVTAELVKMIDSSHVLGVVDDHLEHRDHLVWGQPRSWFHGVLASRVCCLNIHVAFVKPQTEHDVMICGQLLAMPSLEQDVGDLLRQATTVLPNRIEEVGFGIVLVANQSEGWVEVVCV